MSDEEIELIRRAEAMAHILVDIFLTIADSRIGEMTRSLMEGVLAAFAQFENDCRSDRTRAGMRAALELGRWTFLAPIGYLNAPRWSGKSLVEDRERAPFVRRAFEAFATGRFTKKEVLSEITRLGLRTRRGLKVSPQAFDVMLKNRVYIGILDVPDYGVHGRRGDFEPLISEELFYRVQGGPERTNSDRSAV